MDLPDQYSGIGPDLSHHSLSKNVVEGDLMTRNSASIDLVDDVNLSPDDNVEDNDEVNSPYFFALNSMLYKPVVVKAVVPKEGSLFDSVEDVYKVYKNYAAKAGFIVCRGHESKAGGIIVNKEFVCSKEGIKRVELKEFDSLKQDCDDKKVKRKRYEFRTNCKARLYVIIYGDKYKVKTFVEDHNHGFFTAEDRYLQKSHRSMSVAHQYSAIKASNLNIGPCMSFNFIAELLGGYENVGATKTDFKNLSRDIYNYIGKYDAQMIIDKFSVLKERDENFTFEFKTNTQEEGFKKRLCRIVWRESDEPEEFVRKWNSLLNEYNFDEHKWLNDMFNIKEKWIPAYFRDIPMSVLMNTTSRSESENYFFGHNSNWSSALVHFLFCYESALDQQRNNQCVLDNNTRTGKTQLKTRQAVEIEIVASVDSCTGSMKNLGYVKDTDKEWYREFKVDYDEESHSVKCSCLHFERRGLLCRHAFYTLRANSIKKIPKQYLLRRWRKEAVVLPPLGSSYKASGSSGSSISTIYSKVNGIINQCGYDEEKLSKFLEQLSVYESELESSTVPQTSASKEQSLSSMIGIPVPPALKVFPPDTGKNKGGISGHRFKPSNNDVRIKVAKEDHDFRNCPNNPNRKKLNPKKVIKKTNQKQKTKKNESSKANSQQGADVFNFSSEEDSDC
ncbi:protein FAR1-RELATED SEQUENCE 5 [Artemisia annua]|uniref:Protein FAR1-RELATED SEQUENCE 5 n=1 Tax=Artemisia annua TaxID=35608 RepID=A0A2U1PMT9_ARTAN|nr:protein FAR1-RELATED SEQUENCE 5 [Artemisia annua]